MDMSVAKLRSKVYADSRLTSKISTMEFYSMCDDCINHVLDWLPIEDLYSMRVTCKRLYLLANEHYQRTYGQVEAHYHDCSIGISRPRDLQYSWTYPHRIDIKYHKSFATLAQKIYFSADSFENASKILLKINQNVKLINIHAYEIDCYHIYRPLDTVKNMCKNVETIYVETLNDSFFRFFANLEYIHYYAESNYETLSGNYPMLKQFDWQCSNKINKRAMESFFKRHPNIKVFSSDEPIDTTDWLLSSGIKFDDIALFIGRCDEFVEKVIENVHSLHKNQQIKRLHLKIDAIDLLLSPNLPTIKYLESVRTNIVNRPDEIVNALIALPNLKMLIYGWRYAVDLDKRHFELLAQKMVKLEEFHTNSKDVFDHFNLFARYSAKLKCIYVKCKIGIEINVTGTLQMLDKERRQLNNACKLTIYMNEICYMQMKDNSSTSSYGLVEIKRIDSYPLSKHPLRPQLHYYEIEESGNFFHC